MKFLADMNNDQFLKDAFDERLNAQFTRKALKQRNIYLALLLTGIICVLISAFADRALLSALSLGLAILSLIIKTKYDTQIRFLNSIRHQAQARAAAEKTTD